MKHNIEIFTAGCGICRETVESVKKTVCGECKVTVYDLRDKCETGICEKKAKEYKISSVPAIVVDGKKLREGRDGVEEIKKFFT